MPRGTSRKNEPSRIARTPVSERNLRHMRFWKLWEGFLLGFPRVGVWDFRGLIFTGNHWQIKSWLQRPERVCRSHCRWTASCCWSRNSPCTTATRVPTSTFPRSCSKSLDPAAHLPQSRVLLHSRASGGFVSVGPRCLVTPEQVWGWPNYQNAAVAK